MDYRRGGDITQGAKVTNQQAVRRQQEVAVVAAKANK